MKKVLLTLTLITSSLLNAQDNWINTIPHGFDSSYVEFDGIKAFNNKLYIVGDSSNYSSASKIFLYSTVTGDTNAVQETGLNAVLQGGAETQMTSVIANSNYLI